MSTIYLQDYRDASPEGRIIREWNSGSTLRGAVQRLESWYGIQRSVVISFWGGFTNKGMGVLGLNLVRKQTQILFTSPGKVSLVPSLSCCVEYRRNSDHGGIT